MPWHHPIRLLRTRRVARNSRCSAFELPESPGPHQLTAAETQIAPKRLGFVDQLSRIGAKRATNQGFPPWSALVDIQD